jgi:uncharacterized OB-fold protein
MTVDAGVPLPDRDCELLRPYWDAAARGEWRLPRCTGCGRFAWYPEAECDHCGGADFDWELLSGRGRVFSFVIVRRALYAPFAGLVPYVSGIVTLDEDPRVRIVTRFLDTDPDSIAIDMPVKVRFADFGYPLTSTGVVGPFWEIDT